MKVFNLRCEHEHAFEGWFASGEAFDSQLESGLLECPVCGSSQVRRMPSAPRLNLSAGAASDNSAAQATGDPGTAEMHKMWLKMARYIRENTEDVGERFAEEARRMHYAEAPERAIRGQTSREQARELAEEGIEVFSFPMPKGQGGPLQ
jgi:hypothetical protein